MPATPPPSRAEFVELQKQVKILQNALEETNAALKNTINQWAAHTATAECVIAALILHHPTDRAHITNKIKAGKSPLAVEMLKVWQRILSEADRK